MSSPAYRMLSKNGKSETGFAPDSLLLPLIRARVLNALVRAIGATVYQVGNELALTRALPNATLVSAPPLCVVGGAVQSVSAVLMHTDPGLLVLSGLSDGSQAPTLDGSLPLKPKSSKFRCAWMESESS